MATGKIGNRWQKHFIFGHIVDIQGQRGYFEIQDNPELKGKEESLVKDAPVVFEKRSSKRGDLKFEAYNVRLQGTSSQQSKQSTDGRKQSASPSQETGKSKPVPGKTFHNPYTFVPSPPRKKAIQADGFAGDFDPLECGRGLDHASLNPKWWTGHIPIKLTAVTPLVLPKSDGKERSIDKHQTYDVLDRISESSLRGMLRSAYEVVTNSRYACFHNPDRLTYRMSRRKEQYENSPEELLHCSLKPAKQRSELSPADRLFGWVLQKRDRNQEQDHNQESESGYKSRVRVVCEDGERPEIIQRFDGGALPLTILGQPKPAQGRFYVAKDAQGTPQDDGISKSDAGYKAGKALRGRKQYWHHKGLEFKKAPEYWKRVVEGQIQQQSNGRYQEYHRPETDPQNRSIKGWIKPDTVFKASLYVQNLQPQEVGALLWLLSLPEDHYFKLGYGKPLGFGSMKMEIDEEWLEKGCLPLGTGDDWKAYYADLNACLPATLDDSQRDVCIQQFKASMVTAYNNPPSFDKLPFISDFLRVLRGPIDNAFIHYPRVTLEPKPDGKNFEWFVDNDHYRDGEKLALPEVTAEEGLPYKPTN